MQSKFSFLTINCEVFYAVICSRFSNARDVSPAFMIEVAVSMGLNCIFDPQNSLLAMFDTGKQKSKLAMLLGQGMLSNENVREPRSRLISQ